MKLNSLSRATEKRKAQTVSYIASEPPVITTSIPSRLNTERILYAIAGGVLFMLMLLGFQQFYLHGKAFPDHPIFPPLKGVIIAHGLSMTCWMVLFVVQTLLVVTNQFRTHMLLGFFGIAVAISVVIFSSWTAIATTRLEPELIRQGLNRKQFMIVPLSDMLKFGVLVSIALWNRSRPEIHRPMMLLATLTMISAATGRIPAINNLYVATIWGQWFGAFFPKLVIGLVFLFVKTLFTQRFDRWLAGGLTMLAILSLLIWQMAPTVAWERVANLLTN
ncbi:MAG: hypothetical protein J7502_08425 [Flavisolibacter sp.]|nr:hypothetical protein [Flavisolibacter sp.]